MRLCSKCNKEPILKWHTSYGRNCYRELDRKRYYKHRKSRLAYNRKNYLENKERWIKKYKAHRENNPEKYKAGYTLRNAVKAGKIKRGKCEVCGQEKAHGHHKDYSKPLDVRWFCIKHHAEFHRKYDINGKPKDNLLQEKE